MNRNLVEEMGHLPFADPSKGRNGQELEQITVTRILKIKDEKYEIPALPAVIITMYY